MTNKRRNMIKTDSDVIHLAKWLAYKGGNINQLGKWLTSEA